MRSMLSLLAVLAPVFVAAYVVYLIAGGIATAQAAGAYDPVLVRDQLHVNEHHLSGMVTVHNSCDQLSVDTHTVAATTFELVFKTWRDPSVSCVRDDVPRHFHTVLFAPAVGVTFIATLDGIALPIGVVTLLPNDQR